MEARATAKYMSMSALKVRRAIDGLRGLPVDEASARLRVAKDRASRVVGKVLRSAVANAENNYELSADDLIVTRAFADRGPATKRMQPRARGRADVVTKQTSHITIVVGERSGQ
jgi:large subunit ribosomal protein L22